MMSLSFFAPLPEEVLRSILEYMDIPSLAVLSTTHKAQHRNIAYLASDDATWYKFIQARFGIGCNHRSRQEGVVLVKRGGVGDSSSASHSASLSQKQKERRPTSYGGKNWKDVYQAFSCIMRIPETSITSASQRSGSNAVFASPYRRARNSTRRVLVGDFFGVWCMVNHAENCRTKTVEGRRMGSVHHHQRRCSIRNGTLRGESITNLPYRTDRKYIELKLCLQNTKSGSGRIVLPDVSSIHIASLEEDDYFSVHGWDTWDENYDSTFKLIQDGPWAPKIILRSSSRFCSINHDNVLKDQQSTDEYVMDWNEVCCGRKKDLIFHPFDVIVLSVHISCPENLVYETDVLSSMASIRVPVVAECWSMNKRDVEGGESTNNTDTSIAYFLPEDDLWEYYCQLPGGCLSLTDRSRLVPV